MRCVSFCPAESYKLSAIASFFKFNGYQVRQYRKVLHLSLPTKTGDIFIFSYGCLVIWGLQRDEEVKILDQLQQFSINLLPKMECDRFIFRKGDHTEMATHARFNADIITLESDSVQLKLAISYGLAQSIQLEYYESFVQKTIEKNEQLPQQLAKYGSISLSQKSISKRMGEIFLARSSINLNSEYLAAPEYFWEYPSLEQFYLISEKFLDIPRRVSALNQKLDILHELLGMLTGRLQHWHSSVLEITIIALIVIEIIISIAVMK